MCAGNGVGKARAAHFLALEMMDGRRRTEKQTAEDYVPGQSLSFREERDFSFAEVPVVEMMLVLAALLRAASPCKTQRCSR